MMSLASVIKSAFTTLFVGSLSASYDGLFWDELCSTYCDPSLAEDNLEYKENFKGLKLKNRRLWVESRLLINETENLRAHNHTLAQRMVFLEIELEILALAIVQQERESSLLQAELRVETKLRKELQETNKGYEQERRRNEDVIRMLTKQPNPCMAVEERRQNLYCHKCNRAAACQVRFIKPCHPSDEIWKLENLRGAFPAPY